MSGSGGGGGGGRRTATGTPTDGACDRLVVTTILNSPVPKVVATLKKGDRLNVVAHTAGAVTRLEARTLAGSTAGSLTPPELVQILNCIRQGHSYVAIVVSDPTGAAVNVRIQSTSKP